MVGRPGMFFMAMAQDPGNAVALQYFRERMAKETSPSASDTWLPGGGRKGRIRWKNVGFSWGKVEI
jgi:hypothetical protein